MARERRGAVARARRVIVKVGSSIVTADGRGLNRRAVNAIARDIASVLSGGAQVILVSSGAVAAGNSHLEMKRRPRTIPEKQATAAVGQSRLIRAWERAFVPHDRSVGQVLLTSDDLGNRRRFLNARHTLLTLLRLGVVPVINENDTVVVEEIKFGDNDQLAALVTNLIEADLLIFLTDTEGLYDRDPRREKRPRLIPLVRRIGPALEAMAGNAAGGTTGTGGIASKIAAARKSAQFGVPCVVASGRRRGCIGRILAGEPIGTLFLPDETPLTSRKHWIAHTGRARGALRVDSGAVDALRDRGKSLLPSGVTAVKGQFGVGDLVQILDPRGREFARGLAAYRSEEIDRIKGLRTSDIVAALGYKSTDEIIHRDDLVLL
ncbi:MAG: glutamate 5-kinase [Myxococcota bacterium]